LSIAMMTMIMAHNQWKFAKGRERKFKAFIIYQLLKHIYAMIEKAFKNFYFFLTPFFSRWVDGSMYQILTFHDMWAIKPTSMWFDVHILLSKAIGSIFQPSKKVTLAQNDFFNKRRFHFFA
jgi:hypothetical protein